MFVPVTAYYAALLSLCYLYLSALVVVSRRNHKVSLGHGEDRHLEQAIRAHGNFAEYVPLTLLLLLVAEINQIQAIYLHGCGIALLFGRVLHAYGLKHHYGASWQRVWGSAITFVSVGGLAILNLLDFYF